ncbi:unnamed protein product [Bursaphelenchus xylophilus]|uniref:Ribosome-recycling factor, mitochondrial n=1 Tax=Bursaphelenchus xylophilus TaxID=6326 RepID=A0A1I7S112_BURXY|nr:unnamed protein product [Bursaphelenchus xylophilus]CAG9087997.1 unnamed protein product [Bursaphelenchus xylophilus]
MHNIFRVPFRSARLCSRFLRRNGILAELSAIAREQQLQRGLSTSAIVEKVHKQKPKKGQQSALPPVNDHLPFQFDEYDYALSEMKSLEGRLEEELQRHFGTKVDLRQYEDIKVHISGTDEVHRLGHLARISLKTPQLIMINFTDKPTAIKDAKVALQKSALNVNPQHEGIMLYIPVPRMTRERREQLAKDARTVLLNDYKKALNDVYSKSDKKASTTKELDKAKAKRAALLNLKHQYEKRAAALIEEKQKQLLTEVA